MTGFTDLDWARNVDNRKSITSYAFSIVSGVITWSSKKQNTVSLSLVEAKYQAMCAATCEVVWLRRLLQNVEEEHKDATTKVQSNLLIIWCFTRTLNTLIHNSTLSGRKCNQKKSIWYIVIHVIMLQTFSLSLLAKLSLKCLGRC